MNDKDFQVLWATAFGYEDRETYITENEEALTKTFRTSAKRKEELGKIWDVAHMSILDLIGKAGYNQSSFARHFCIPLRTVQGWCSDSKSAGRECPPWAKLGFARQLNML